jgi:hypothetical protein
MGAALAMNYFQSTFHTGLSGEKVSVVTALYTVYVFALFNLYIDALINSYFQWAVVPWLLPLPARFFPTDWGVANACSPVLGLSSLGLF